ncbi:putative large, multifunctional secreted protein [Lunatimonas lonarensis]|uniref:Putative large, multifunctional secreted protein n=1 Tax=Lunatimonas lonarensis TaxID=1232681 RepID=R7ZLU8_9BACT|nr:large, multifunctional protein [Lunatimonas lonarensis]EON75063.1 putative large, multifunctional secreted protein [Lunatimonas lonarensis]
MNYIKRFILGLCLIWCGSTFVLAQESPMEEDYFKILRVSSPEGTLLEVGGLAMLPNGNLGVSTRRGDVYIVENPTSPRPYFRKFASGLHEILGLVYKDGALYCAQRGELTKLIDSNHDGVADIYETIHAWPVSGHYHEYSFGPVIGKDGDFFVSGNVAFGNEEWWRGESRVPYRGWIMKIKEDGSLLPWATGMRSPAGLGIIDGELFYTENQGDYMASGGIWHIRRGTFAGHPAGLRWTDLPNSPLRLTTTEFNQVVDPRQVRNEQGRMIKPENVVDETYLTMFEAKKKLPDLKLPAVWFPYGIHGISTSEPIKIPDGNMGPFGGQILVGDQGQSKIMRVFMEEVNGELQGMAIDFRSGFRSGVLRMAWAPDGSLFVGETNRGWGSAGDANEGLERLVWTGEVPFEIRTVKAMPDGFEVEFTKPADRKSLEDLASYSVSSFIYKYHPVYGSPPVDNQQATVKGVKVSPDNTKVRIVVEGLKQYYIHHLYLDGVREENTSYSLVHPSAYYTLNNIPSGAALANGELTTFDSRVKIEASKPVDAAKATTPVKASAAAPAKVSQEEELTFEVIQPLLAKNTCIACHNKDTKQVGPAYVDVAKRNYTPEQIVELIHTPRPENWPEYATPMPPMPHVPREEALKIAKWITSLNK